MDIKLKTGNREKLEKQKQSKLVYGEGGRNDGASLVGEQ